MAEALAFVAFAVVLFGTAAWWDRRQERRRRRRVVMMARPMTAFERSQVRKRVP